MTNTSPNGWNNCAQACYRFAEGLLLPTYLNFLRTEGLKRKRLVSAVTLKGPGRYQPLLQVVDKIINAEPFNL